MPLQPHPIIDPIPAWIDQPPDAIMTHAIQIYKDTYILHVQPRQGTACYLCSQTLDPATGKAQWLNYKLLPDDVLSLLDVIFDLCNRLIHGDEDASSRHIAVYLGIPPDEDDDDEEN